MEKLLKDGSLCSPARSSYCSFCPRCDTNSVFSRYIMWALLPNVVVALLCLIQDDNAAFKMAHWLRHDGAAWSTGQSGTVSRVNPNSFSVIWSLIPPAVVPKTVQIFANLCLTLRAISTHLECSDLYQV